MWKAKVKDQLLAHAIAFMWTEMSIQVRGIYGQNGLRHDLRVSKSFHGRSVPQFTEQIRVTCTLNVPMLCPHKLLILATPLVKV